MSKLTDIYKVFDNFRLNEDIVKMHGPIWVSYVSVLSLCNGN